MTDFKFGSRGNLVTDRDLLHASDGYARQVAALQELKDGKNMTGKTMTLEGGKYTLIRRDDGGMDALRNGSRWRDLTGDKLILALVQRIDELESQPAERGEAVAKCIGVIEEIDEDTNNVLVEWAGPIRCGDKLYTAPPPAAGMPDENEASVAAIQFALTAEDGFAWLRLWNEGDFEACRREWTEAPSQCYVGADPLLSATPSPTIDMAAVHGFHGFEIVENAIVPEGEVWVYDKTKLRAIGDAK